jgi:hypothetical protein
MLIPMEYLPFLALGILAAFVGLVIYFSDIMSNSANDERNRR